MLVENSLTLATRLLSRKPFCGKELQKTLLTLSQIPDEKAHSLIMSPPGENKLAGVSNEKLIFSGTCKGYYRILDFPFQLWQRI